MSSPSTRGPHRPSSAPSNSSASTPNVASNANLACDNTTRDQWLIVLQRWKFRLSGVMEVGSELRLLPNGRFDYMLAYGALDELASGCWSREGGTVTLIASKFETSMEDPLKFDRLELKVLPALRLASALNSVA